MVAGGTVVAGREGEKRVKVSKGIRDFAKAFMQAAGSCYAREAFDSAICAVVNRISSVVENSCKRFESLESFHHSMKCC